MIDFLYWTFTILAIIGVILNIQKDSRCFIIWTATNAAFAIESWFVGAWNMTFLFSIYFVLAVIGAQQWREKK